MIFPSHKTVFPLKPVERPWDGTCVRPECSSRAVEREILCREHLPAHDAPTDRIVHARRLADRIVLLRRMSPACPASEIAAEIGCSVQHVYNIVAEHGDPFGAPHAIRPRSP